MNGGAEMLPDLARQAAAFATDKREQGERLVELIEFHLGADFADQWRDEAAVLRAGRYVSDVRTADARRQQEKQAVRQGVSVGSGRLVSPVMSVRTEHGRQLVLWERATPAQFVEAVHIEQAVANGRLRANRPRYELAERIQTDRELMQLPTLGDDCLALGVDRDTLDLAELPMTEES